MKKKILAFLFCFFYVSAIFAQGVTLSSPSNGSTINGVSTTLYWNTISGSTKYDWRCDTTQNFNSGALQSGYVTSSYNYVSVSGLYYGSTYYWQVRARNASDTTPWSPVWHFTTATGLVALSSPASGNTISGVSTTLYWNTITGSTKYDYQCDITSNFNSQYLQSGYVTSSYNYVSISNLRYGTCYYWRVRARNSVDTTAWSPVWKFFTASPSVTLSYPSDGSQLSGVSTTLYWNTISGSTKYDWRCDTVPTFNSNALQSGYVTGSYDYVSVSSLYYGTTYYWQVRARNANDTTAWSPMWKFTTAAGPVVLSSPANGTTLSGVSTTLYWNQITGSTRYDWQCDITPNFNSSFLQSNYTTSSYDYASVSGLRYGTTYYWRVRARNSVDTTAWSEVRTFNTVQPTLTLDYPADGTHLSGVSTTLYWNGISGSTRYDWRCDTVPTFNSSALQSGYVTSSYDYVSVSSLYYGTTYYWQVRARNANDTTNWSAMWQFTTADGPVILSYPTDGTIISGVSTTVYWNLIAGSTRYDWQCDVSPNFNTSELMTGSVTSSYDYVSISNLHYGTSYFWRVRARNSVDTTTWSAAWKFCTVLEDLTLSYPTDGAQLGGVSTTLYWNSISGSTRYDWRCDTVPTFSSGALQSGYVTSSYDYVSVSSLYYGTTYYWQVRARNANDTTDWSDMWRFTTGDGPVVLDYPTSGTIISGVSTTLYWHQITGSTRYDWQCDTTPNFNSALLQTGYVLSSYNYQSVTGLRYGTTYYWRVRARNSVDTTAWSAVWTFSTIMEDLTLSYPTDGAQLSGVNTTLYWNGISGSTRYDWRCDTVPTFSSGALQSGYVTSSYDYVSVSSLYYGTTYYWQVRARNANDTTDWSDMWRFTTADGPVALSSPANAVTLNAVSATLYWNGIPGTTHYDYQCDVSPTFDSPLLISGSVTGSYTYASVSNLHYVSTYYWRVRARNAVDTTQWSAVWYFNTTEHCTINNSFTATACDSYTWNNQTYTQSGTYLQQFTSVQACDSIVTLYLTITSSAPTTENRTICAGDLPYDWNGVTFYDAGSQSVALTSVNGCDSIVTMNLTVSDITPTTESRTICASELPYIWNDVVFASSDTRIVTLVSANGCDSVVTMRLFVNPVDSVTDVLTICAGDLPYVWNGVTFYGAGTQTTTLTAANGCDSVVMMQLDVNSVVNTTEDVSVCASDLPYIWNGLTLNSAGTQTVVLTSVNGCDSVVTLNLTVNPTYNLTEDITIPENELPYVWNGFTFTTGGSQTAQLTSVTGCDSTVTLNLTVTTGIIDFSGREVKCYPNPFGTTLTISGLQIGEWLTMYDATGRVLLRREVSSETEVLNTTALSKGVYFLQTGGQIIKVVRN